MGVVVWRRMNMGMKGEGKQRGGRRKLITVMKFGISDLWISKMAAVRLAGIRESCFLRPHVQILQKKCNHFYLRQRCISDNPFWWLRNPIFQKNNLVPSIFNLIWQIIARNQPRSHLECQIQWSKSMIGWFPALQMFPGYSTPEAIKYGLKKLFKW